MLPNNIKEVKLKIITWNARSLFNYVKKIFLVDILRTEAPDIAILSETFLLEEDALYAKGYRTYKTRNNKRRKGCCILVSKNVMASIITLKNDIEGRYIKISLKSEGIDIPTTISSIYLEPDGDLNKIPIEVLETDIIAGDLNNAQSDLIKNGVYHLKGIENIKPIKVNNKISDHDIIVGESRARIKVNERFTYIEINEKNKVNENDKALKESFKNGKINLLNPKRTIKKDNYLINPQDLDKYEEFAKIKEIYDYEIREKYNRIEKIIRYGEITKDGWYKINSLFNERKATEIYNKDFKAEGIVQYYKELYADNQKRKVLNHNDIKLKICEIIDIIDKLTPSQESKIWPPKSIARDFFGFSQKIIECIISDISLKNEMANFKTLLGIICNEKKNSEIFLHTISKSISFKKRENIRGGVDIRVINVLPAWLIILEKMSIKVIKRIINDKITMIQYGFLEGGDCNLAKLMVWYNSCQKGVKKHLLINIKKAFDSINRNKLSEMIKDDFKEEFSVLLIDFLDIYDTIEIDMLGIKIYPTKGGPQGFAIIPILFCYYLNKALEKVIIKENICLQAYADDLVIQSDNLDDLKEVYNNIKETLKEYDLIINPEKCELLTEDINDKIVDEDGNTEITIRKEVTYLGQKINTEGITEEIIEDKLFGKLKSKLYKIKFLTRLTRIRIFKTYMITRVNHLLPIIALNGHLKESWKCIRRIIFRDILKTQTSPLETAVTFWTRVL